MNSQVTLFDVDSPKKMDTASTSTSDANINTSELEREAYSLIQRFILQVCEDLNLSPDDFTLSAGSGYSTIRYGTFLIMRLKFRGKKHHISFPKSYAGNLSNSIEAEVSKSEPGYVRVSTDLDNILSLASTIQSIIRSAIQHIPKEYDCCSLYMECSDAKKCVKPDKKSALVCGYKKILESGTVFYGKNRTIGFSDTNQQS